jgi:hypothetical protein
MTRTSFSCAYQRHHECLSDSCDCPCHDDDIEDFPDSERMSLDDANEKEDDPRHDD